MHWLSVLAVVALGGSRRIARRRRARPGRGLGDEPVEEDHGPRRRLAAGSVPLTGLGSHGPRAAAGFRAVASERGLEAALQPQRLPHARAAQVQAVGGPIRSQMPEGPDA
jgi:hypothetical protein